MIIKADGVTDDLPAVKEWIKTGGGILPAGIIRVTDSIVLGGIVLKDYTNPDTTTLDIPQYNAARWEKPVPIIGNPQGTVIWLDNSDKSKPVIAYNALGWKTNVISGKIADLTLRGVGIGITTAYTQHLRLYNIIFEGFDNGLVLNNGYFVDAANLRFNKCNRAEYDIRSHMSVFKNTVLRDCKKGFEIHSNQVSLNGYNAQNCEVGLHIAGSNNQIERCVLENIRPSDAQLVVGDKTGAVISGNVFTTLTISSPYQVGIRWEKTAGTMSLDGGSIRSVTFDIIGTPEVYVKNLIGSLPASVIK